MFLQGAERQDFVVLVIFDQQYWPSILILYESVK